MGSKWLASLIGYNGCQILLLVFLGSPLINLAQEIDRETLYNIKLADSLLNEDQDSTAKIYIDKIGKNKGQSLEAFMHYHKLLGDYYLSTSAYKESVASYEPLMKINSKDLDRDNSLKLARGINDYGISLMKIGEFDDAIRAHLKSQEIYDRYNEPQGGSYNYNNIAIIYTELKKIDSALFFHKKSLEYATLAMDTMGIGFNHLNMAVLHADNKEPIKALSHFQLGLKIFEQQGNERMINALKRRLGSYYARIKDYESALSHFKDVLAYYQKTNSNSGLGGTHIAIAEFFLSLDQLDTAKYHLDKALEYYEPTGYAHGLAKCHHQYGTYFLKLGMYEKSLESFEECLNITQGRYRGMSLGSLNGIAQVYFAQGKYKRAINAAERGLQESNYSASPGQLGTAYDILYKSHKALGNKTQALEFLEKYHEEKRKIFDDDQMMSMARIEYQNILERERQIQELEQQKRDLALQQQLERENWIKYSAITIAILLSFIALFAIRSYKIKQKSNTELIANNLELEEMREREKHLSEEAIAAKERELATMAMSTLEKNNLLAELHQKVSFLEKRMSDDLKPSIREMRKTISNSMSLDNSWDSFIHRFEDVHPRFFDRLKNENPNLTINDLKLSAYLKIGMSNKEIANVSHLTLGSVKSNINRLKKKLNLSAEDSVRDYVLRYA